MVGVCLGSGVRHARMRHGFCILNSAPQLKRQVPTRWFWPGIGGVRREPEASRPRGVVFSSWSVASVVLRGMVAALSKLAPSLPSYEDLLLCQQS